MLRYIENVHDTKVSVCADLSVMSRSLRPDGAVPLCFLKGRLGVSAGGMA